MERQPKAESKEYCYSLDEERFYGNYKTKEEAIQAANNESDGRYNTAWIGVVHPIKISDHIEIDYMIETALDSIRDNLLPEIEEIDISDQKTFEAAICETIDEFCSISQYSVEDTEEIDLRDFNMEKEPV